jgi:hypothetical protein
MKQYLPCLFVFVLFGGRLLAGTTVDTLLPPILVCPPDLTVQCEQFDPQISVYGDPVFSGHCGWYDLQETADYTDFDSICNRGAIYRQFLALDSCAGTAACTQHIQVIFNGAYYIKFPDDKRLTDCDSAGYGEPVFFGDACVLLSITYTDEYEPWTPDACFKFNRIWQIINWCAYQPNDELVNIPNPQPMPILLHPDNLPGPTVSACNAAPPWSPTIVKINPTDPQPANFCMFWQDNAKGYVYKQKIRNEDSTPPVLEFCPPATPYAMDTTQNDPHLWNNIFLPNAPAHDLAEYETDISIQGYDNCSGAAVNFQYLLFLDLDADGQQETVVNSLELGSNGLGWNTVRYNNINTPGYLGGTPVSFDHRPVPDDEKYGFALQVETDASTRRAALRWNTAQAPDIWIIPAIPNGRHRIRWIVRDACGGKNHCEYPFRIGDTTLVGTSFTPSPPDITLCQNQPNPFSEFTLISFETNENARVLLRIFDLNGALQWEHAEQYYPGAHTIRIHKNQLAGAGIYYYRLETGNHSVWRKMVFTATE